MSSVNFGGGKGFEFLGKVKLPHLSTDFNLNDKQTKEMDVFLYHQFGLNINEISFMETL